MLDAISSCQNGSSCVHSWDLSHYCPTKQACIHFIRGCVLLIQSLLILIWLNKTINVWGNSVSHYRATNNRLIGWLRLSRFLFATANPLKTAKPERLFLGQIDFSAVDGYVFTGTLCQLSMRIAAAALIRLLLTSWYSLNSKETAAFGLNTTPGRHYLLMTSKIL